MKLSLRLLTLKVLSISEGSFFPDYFYSMSHSSGAVGWSTIYDCSISCSYSLGFVNVFFGRGEGGGGTLNFSSYVVLDPGSTVYPPPQKKIYLE